MELEFLQWINNNLHGSTFFNYFFKIITFLCESGWACILLGVILLFFKKTRRSGVLVLVSLAIGIIITNLILKPVVARPRPFVEDPTFLNFLDQIGYSKPGEYSFPSGHTHVAINTAMVLTLVFKKKGAWAWIPALLIAFSRIFLCVHYPTDVLAGAVIGIVCALVTVLLINKLIDKIVENFQAKKQLKTEEVNENN